MNPSPCQCRYIDASFVLPGWGCCACQEKLGAYTYNGMQRATCKVCDHARGGALLADGETGCVFETRQHHLDYEVPTGEELEEAEAKEREREVGDLLGLSSLEEIARGAPPRQAHPLLTCPLCMPRNSHGSCTFCHYYGPGPGHLCMAMDPSFYCAVHRKERIVDAPN